ncbi:MAG TPA: TIGR00730 family Rossman fold protein [Gemmatimonadales bacterium]|nr:TIGR00730 family Rossman fold protein [Gemmatimonadales bacterium]
MNPQLRRLCVFCGSSAGVRPEYVRAAQDFGRLLVERRIGLVYGGAHVGLMGALADAALGAGGEVVGVIPHALVQHEIAHRGLTELRVVADMHERKATMAELSDGFVALPGGAGTLEELFEVWTWGQLGLHHKPCGLLDVSGYFTRLRAFLDHAASEGFLRTEHRNMLIVETEPKALLDSFARYAAPVAEKWIRQEQRRTS